MTDEDEEEKNGAIDQIASLHTISMNTEMQGYCLVFNRVLKHYLVEIIPAPNPRNDPKMEGFQTLQLRRRPDLDKDAFASAHNFDNKNDINMNNLLEGLIFTHTTGAYCLYYHLFYSRDVERKYIFLLLYTSLGNIMAYMDARDLDTQIEAKEAILVGRRFAEFHLAHRTFIPEVDAERRYENMEKLDIALWQSIHIPFENEVPIEIYKTHPENENSIVNHRMYLRYLYEILNDDCSMDGADFLLNRYLDDKHNPLCHYFALHDQNHLPIQVAKRLYLCEETKHKICIYNNSVRSQRILDRIRDYYGEHIAFYFSFLQFYTLSLRAAAVMGFIWFVVQMVMGSIAVPGSTIVVLLTIIWSTAMTEIWYRQESWLSLKWGMLRHTATAAPRPSFTGTLVISPRDGSIVETYQSFWQHLMKIVFSVSTLVVCMAVVIAIVLGIWVLKNIFQSRPEYSILIGVINSIQIQIMNKLYTKLAFILNDFEGHRLQQDYYNHLVVKRILFMIVNSFNSLYYIAFFQQHDTNTIRLQALRTQLLTLFFTAMVILNFVEVLLPKIPGWMRALVKKCKSDENADKEQLQRASVPMADDGGNTDIEFPVELTDTSFMTPAMWADIESQVELPFYDDTLANTAEIVILHGYVILFVVIFPVMPLLAYVNALFEVRIDIYNLFNCQRPAPIASSGIGVWKTVLSLFNTAAIFTNMALITFRTDLVDNLIGGQREGKIVYFFLVCLILCGAMVCTRMVVHDQSRQTEDAAVRQRHCKTLVTLLQSTAAQN